MVFFANNFVNTRNGCGKEISSRVPSKAASYDPAVSSVFPRNGSRRRTDVVLNARERRPLSLLIAYLTAEVTIDLFTRMPYVTLRKRAPRI